MKKLMLVPVFLVMVMFSFAAKVDTVAVFSDQDEKAG